MIFESSIGNTKSKKWLLSVRPKYISQYDSCFQKVFQLKNFFVVFHFILVLDLYVVCLHI